MDEKQPEAESGQSPVPRVTKVVPMTPVEQHDNDKSSQTQDVLHKAETQSSSKVQENVQSKVDTISDVGELSAPGMKPSLNTSDMKHEASLTVQKPMSLKIFQWIVIFLAFLNLFVIVAFLTIPSLDLALTAAINEATYLVVFYCFYHYRFVLLRFAKIFSLISFFVSVVVGMGHVIIFVLEITAGTTGNFVQRVTNGVPLAELDQQTQAEVIPFVTTVFLIAVGMYIVVFLIPLLTTFFVARRAQKNF